MEYSMKYDYFRAEFWQVLFSSPRDFLNQRKAVDCIKTLFRDANEVTEGG